MSTGELFLLFIDLKNLFVVLIASGYLNFRYFKLNISFWTC